MLSGDDRGGIAVTNDAVYYNGDRAMIRLSATDLSGGVAVSAPQDGIFSDLATGALYLLTRSDGEEIDFAIDGTLTQLGRVTASGTVPTLITLSTPIATFATHQAPAVFAGYGHVVIFAGSASASAPGNWYSVSLPSGAVRLLTTIAMPAHTVCENVGTWGIAETVGGDISVLYVESESVIARFRIATGAVTRIPFTNLSDMCSITLSPSRNRWYFHAEGASQFTATGSEYVGYCDATWTSSP